MKLMVLDGNSIVNRAYYGIRPLTTRQGLYTNAIYGFITTLQRLFLILIGYGGKHRAVVHNVHTAGFKRLVKRAGELIVVAYGFARGFHFG